jgi:hypothetical protein
LLECLLEIFAPELSYPQQALPGQTLSGFIGHPGKHLAEGVSSVLSGYNFAGLEHAGDA